MALEALINKFSAIICYIDSDLVPVWIILSPVLKFDEGIIGFIFRTK